MKPTPPNADPKLFQDAEARVGPVVRVAMAAAIDGEYSYAIPDELASQVEPGRRVMVRLGRNRKPQAAFAIDVGQGPWISTLKPVVEVIDDVRLLSPELLELGQWISRYYACPLGKTLTAMVPEAIRSRRGFRQVRVVRLPDPPTSAAPSAPPDESGGRVPPVDGCDTGVSPASPKRKAVLAALTAHPDGIALPDLARLAGVTPALINTMRKAGEVRVDITREPAPPPDFAQERVEPAFDLNPDQRAAINRVVALTEAGAFKAVLLYGKSGSGKTEVYIRSIQDTLRRGKQAILLVPEIALTTQIVERLAARFDDVAVIHSGLTGVQRSLIWSAIARGIKRVVIGTRSAVFAPCPALGLIVVDEEQEGSFKNQQSPRFHTRDVAIKRAQLAGCPILLGSATPSLETWYNCDRRHHFEKITLPNRVAGLRMPAVDFVDMQIEQKQRKGLHLLSRKMEEELKDTLARKEQAILLLNRRGYASYLVCSRCRNVVMCPHCKAAMVYHQPLEKALCHFCGAKMVMPKNCGDPSCRGTLIRWGMGTQRVEEELRTLLPEARIARADSDTMLKVANYEQMIDDFHARRLDILIGTQMVAKGLDFPFVSFVGVVNADTSAAVPDFRAAERTFQLVTQVAGRAGRSHTAGRVLVQSLAGLTPPLQFAANHDYDGFAAYELIIRKRLGWPPFSRLARVIISHQRESHARALADTLADAIREHCFRHGLPADLLGPATAPMSRLKGRYRFELLLRTPNASRLLALLEHLRHHDILTPNTPDTLVDVDPVSLT